MSNNLIISLELKDVEKREMVNVVIRGIGNVSVEVKPCFWYVKAPLTALEACAKVWSAMGQRGSLFVVDATNKRAAWQNIGPDNADILKHQWHA